LCFVHPFDIVVSEMSDDDLARDVWSSVSALFLAERPRINAELGELGLHPVQALALRFLEPGEPRPMSTLAGLLHCDASNVTNIADRLESAGLVVRRPAEQDRRVRTLVLTALGERVRSRVADVWGRPPAAFAALPPEDLEALQRILARALDRGGELVEPA
jgi:DNA-binding MarR family transcriptional regulator